MYSFDLIGARGFVFKRFDSFNDFCRGYWGYGGGKLGVKASEVYEWVGCLDVRVLQMESVYLF